MVDDDKDDFTFGNVGEDFTDDDGGWGSLEDDAGGSAEPDEASSDAVEDEPAAPAQAEIVEETPVAGATEEGPARRSSARMLLYGLLVMVLSAAGFYYFTTSPTPPAAEKRPAPAKQTLAMPERPAPAAQPETTAAVAMPEPKPAAEAEVPKGTLREILPTEPAPAVEPAPAAAVANVEPVEPVVAPTPAKSEPKAATAKPAPAKVSKPAAAGRYTIQAGAFVDHVNRDETLAKLKQLGFDGQVETIQRVMPMTRLLIGVFPPDEARAKVAELSGAVPTAFVLRQGAQLAVYAGSFYEIDKARVFADELFKKGIRVQEEKAEVEVTLSRLTFGGFPDKATADAAAKRARAAGLEANVIRTP